jgi:hypothetical protein
MNWLEIKNTKQADYNICQQEWESIGGTKSTYSMFESIDEDGYLWLISYPDFNDKTPLIEGKWFIQINDWNGYETKRPIDNPTWMNIADTLERNDGHHIFLEGIEVDEVNRTLILQMGS